MEKWQRGQVYLLTLVKYPLVKLWFLRTAPSNTQSVFFICNTCDRIYRKVLLLSGMGVKNGFSLQGKNISCKFLETRLGKYLDLWGMEKLSNLEYYIELVVFWELHDLFRSPWNSSVSVVVRLWAEWPRFNSQQGRAFFVFATVSTQVLGPTQPRIHWVLRSLPKSKVGRVWSWPFTSI
jgi:hypothetical protein